MSGNSKCLGTGCKRRNDCRRYTEPSSAWQSIIMPEFTDGGKACEYFIDNRKRRTGRK